jgi:DNA polymerase elongation subunit (family B)
MSKEYISIVKLQSLIDSGSEILWTGSESDTEVRIRVKTDDQSKFYYIDTTIFKVPKDCYVVSHNEATSKSLEFTGITWQKRGWLRSIRVASIFGINVGCNVKPGLGFIPKLSKDLCTMGYDIETSQHLVKTGGFPPPYSRITSIALWCTCGYCEAWTTIPHGKVPQLNYCSSSNELVKLSIHAIMKHMPQWLVGYNCYQFDNCSLLMHAPADMRKLFRALNSGAKSVSRHAFCLDLPGINNVDLYAYLDKRMRNKYKALSLGAVAKFHNLSGKTQMPTTDDEAIVYDLISYNINDSKLTANLWHITNACEEVINLCAISCAPVVDCVRYVSGTMVSCAVSSYCIANGMVMDWSECNLRIGYEGGTVLDPLKEVFKNVTVCDFSAMYPTLIKDIAISPENIEILSNCSGFHDDKILWWNDNNTLACIKGKIIRYNRNTQCMTRDVLEVITSLRNTHKKTNVAYSTALKVLANSLYGALGFASSPLHSPRCAATVTVAGRTSLALAYTVFQGMGLTVVYGDTDSCFLAAGSNTGRYFNNNVEKHIDSALSIFHRILSFTPFPNMRMEREKEYKSVLLVDKKHYAYIDSDNKLQTKGLSQTRKDRIGICRDITGIIAQKLLSSDNMDTARSEVSRIVNICYNSAIAGSLDMYSVSKEVRYEGNSCYRYTNIHGEDVNIPVTRADNTSMIEYDPNKVLQFLERDINKLCIPARVGTVKNMLMDAEL